MVILARRIELFRLLSQRTYVAHTHFKLRFTKDPTACRKFVKKESFV